MFGGVNLLSPSSRFAGPRALAPMWEVPRTVQLQEIYGMVF